MKTMLKPWDEVDERNVSRMVGKAMCAYANWMQAKSAGMERCAIAHESEYEATVRCIEMFVREDLYEVQRVIRNRAMTELLEASA